MDPDLLIVLLLGVIEMVRAHLGRLLLSLREMCGPPLDTADMIPVAWCR
jgi:hypothetical protein